MKFVLLSLVTLAVAHAHAAPLSCQPHKILASSHSTFFNRKNATYWVATEKTSVALFKRLKFRAVPRKKELKIKNLSYGGMQACPLNIEFTKIYLAPHGPDSLKVINNCEEQIAINLGFHNSGIEGDNYGTTETGRPIAWRTLFVCTNGSRFTNCDRPTLEMQKCFEELAQR